jgi:hypothetical protein
VSKPAHWPEAPADGWLETCATIHMWTQIVGKVKLARAPMSNHWWNIAFYVTPVGLTTSVIPAGERTFQVDFDFLAHRLVIALSDGRREEMKLSGVPLREFYGEFFARLRTLGLDTKIWPASVELPRVVRFAEDSGHSEYRSEVAERLAQILVVADGALRSCGNAFLGKVSPVHFFWGSFDLAVTRFSGRRAPEHPGGVPHLADWVTREAYSHEVASFGFWPGTAGGYERPAFYAYAHPQPDGFAAGSVQPDAAFYSETLREYLLPYDAIRDDPDPTAAVQAFVRSTYEAAASLGGWDRAALERSKR